MGLRLFHSDSRPAPIFSERNVRTFSSKKPSCSRSVSAYTKETVTAPNPNPFRFKIVKEEVVNGKSILLVWYPDCETFDGYKLLLLKGKYISTESLDPHFLSSEHIILARFEPNEIGWKLAKACAKIN